MSEHPLDLDEQAVDPYLARVAVELLETRRREALIWASAAGVIGAVLLVAGAPALGFPPLLGAVAGFLIATCAHSDRETLLARLVRQRSAYDIPAVAAKAQRYASPAAQAHAAKAVGRLLLEADGHLPSHPGRAAVLERVSICRSDLVEIAFALARPDAGVHPSTLFQLQRALSTTPASGPGLRVSLRRVLAGLET